MPFIFMTGASAIAVSAVLAGLALFGVGAAITYETGLSIWISGTRQLAFGMAAAAITFGIGRSVGVAIA